MSDSALAVPVSRSAVSCARPSTRAALRCWSSLDRGSGGGCGGASYTGCGGAGSGSGSGWYSGMACVGCATAAGARGGQLLVELGHPLTQVGVLLDEPGQLVLDQIEEGIDLVLVVAALADGWLAERDVVDVGWCERHCLPP